MWTPVRTLTLTAAVCGFAVAVPCSAAVSLRLTDQDATPTSTAVVAGGTFTVSVFIDATNPADPNNPNNTISGVDYFLRISPNGVSGSNVSYFEIRQRTSTTLFSPIVDDNSSAVAIVPLTTGQGTDQGGDRASQSDLTGTRSNEVATFNIGTLAGTPAGSYTLSFYTSQTGSSTLYAGARPGGLQSPPTFNFASLGTFAVTVPEPASMMAALPAVAWLASRRRIPSKVR